LSSRPAQATLPPGVAAESA